MGSSDGAAACCDAAAARPDRGAVRRLRRPHRRHRHAYRLGSRSVPVPGSARRPSPSLCWGGPFLRPSPLHRCPRAVVQSAPGADRALGGSRRRFAFGTYAAGGADSFGYISQAELLAHGRLTDTMPSHPAFDWPDIPARSHPWRSRAARNPACWCRSIRPGLSLLMAPLTWIHPSAVFLRRPALRGAARCGCCLRLGRELEDPSRPARSARCCCPSARRSCCRRCSP